MGGNEYLTIALGLLVGIVGWLTKRVVDDFDADVKTLKEEQKKLDERLTDHIEASYKSPR
jgi:hypothetical protein